MKLFHRVMLLSVVLALAGSPLRAEDAQVTDALTNLLNPSGIAIRPGTGEIFISDSGALRVLRFDPASGKSETVIGNYPKDVYGKGPMYDIGPLGLLFLDKDTLAVGDGGLPDGSELVRIYTVPPKGKKLNFDETKYQTGPLGPGEDSPMGEGNFYQLAEVGGTVYITSNGDDTKGWLLKFDLKDGKPGKLVTGIATKVATGVDAPVGITTDKQGRLVVGQMGEVNIPGDSLLTIYDPKTGELVAKAETGLSDIAALAYSPKTGKLYCVDFAWAKPADGGLFRLDVSQEKGKPMSVNAVKIASLDKPSAMAFAADGTLYVTVFGTQAEGSDARPGKLVKLSGL